MSETKLKTSDRLALIRKELKEVAPLPEGAFQVGTDTYVVQTATGLGKLTYSAIKDEDFDPAFEQEQFFFERQEKAKTAAAKEAKAAADKAAKLAAKEAKAKTAKVEAEA